MACGCIAKEGVCGRGIADVCKRKEIISCLVLNTSGKSGRREFSKIFRGYITDCIPISTVSQYKFICKDKEGTRGQEGEECPTLARTRPARVGHPRFRSRLRDAPPAHFQKPKMGHPPLHCNSVEIIGVVFPTRIVPANLRAFGPGQPPRDLGAELCTSHKGVIQSRHYGIL